MIIDVKNIIRKEIIRNINILPSVVIDIANGAACPTLRRRSPPRRYITKYRCFTALSQSLRYNFPTLASLVAPEKREDVPWTLIHLNTSSPHRYHIEEAGMELH